VRAPNGATARDVYLFLAANGWEAALARYKKAKRIASEHNSEWAITVGEFLDAVFRVSTNRSTVEGYATAFRKIDADLFGFSGDPSKFDYRSGDRKQWLAKVHNVELSNMTPAKIHEWKQSFLAVAENHRLQAQIAKPSDNQSLSAANTAATKKSLSWSKNRLGFSQ